MKKALIILPILIIVLYLVLCFPSISSAQSPESVVISENKDSITVVESMSNLYLLENKFDTVLFNTETNCAEWVKWKITVDRKPKVKRSKFPFTADDTRLLTDKVTSEDYNGSGYDRGHLSPAADNSHSTEAMKDCMEMTNIIPQTPELNRGPWKKLEENCRDWCKRDGSTVYIVAGPIYSDTAEVKFIGRKRKIQVPDKCFKVVLIAKRYNEKAMGWIMENNNNPEPDYQKYRVSVDSIEKLTGYDFFNWLPDSLENEIEK